MDDAGKENESFESLLTKCLDLIEQKLNWGRSNDWSTRDFETLSERIQGETGVNLSIATLKRLWGKIKYENKPTSSTLDAVSRFVGFENWRAFVAHHQNLQVGAPHRNGRENGKAASPTPGAKPSRRIQIVIATLALVTLAVIGAYQFKAESQKQYTPADFEFVSEKVVARGVPNSVLFEYDASAASPGDTVSIQQSWDPRLRAQVPHDGRTHNSIYYYPGFFKAKLVVNNQVMQEHDLFIESDGWLPLVAHKEVPMYFTADDAMQKGAFGLTVEKLESRFVLLQPETPWLSYYNVRDFDGLTIGNFNFETVIKNDYAQGTSICQLSQVLVLYESNALFIPLSIKGCVSSLEVKAPKLDLAALGCNLSEWVTVTCQAKDGKGSVMVNGNPAFEFEAPVSEKIVGLVYRFQGPGSIRSVVLSRDTGEKVYEDHF